MPKAYIIGPTIGFRKLNIELFEKVADVLTERGIEPVVPHHLFADEENEKGRLNFHDALTRRRNALYECDYAILLPGYAEDRFGCLEALSAKQMKIQRFRYDQIKQVSNVDIG